MSFVMKLMTVLLYVEYNNYRALMFHTCSVLPRSFSYSGARN